MIPLPQLSPSFHASLCVQALGNCWALMIAVASAQLETSFHSLVFILQFLQSLCSLFCVLWALQGTTEMCPLWLVTQQICYDGRVGAVVS